MKIGTVYGTRIIPLFPYPWQWPGVFCQSNDPGTGDGGSAGGGNTGDPGSGNNPPPNTPPGNGAGGGNGDPSNTGGQGGQTPPEPPKPASFTPEQQAEINRIVGRTRQEERKKLKDESDTEAARQRGEFEKLYNEEKSKREALEPEAATAKDLSEIIHTSIDARIKDWPKEVKEMDPGKETPAKVRLIWVDKSEGLAKKLLASDTAPDMQHGRGGGGQADAKPEKTYISGTYTRPKFGNQP